MASPRSSTAVLHAMEPGGITSSHDRDVPKLKIYCKCQKGLSLGLKLPNFQWVWGKLPAFSLSGNIFIHIQWVLFQIKTSMADSCACEKHLPTREGNVFTGVCRGEDDVGPWVTWHPALDRVTLPPKTGWPSPQRQGDPTPTTKCDPIPSGQGDPNISPRQGDPTSRTGWPYSPSLRRTKHWGPMRKDEPSPAIPSLEWSTSLL